MGAALATDVHQHLWPEQLVDRLRARTRAPYLRGWTLHTVGEPAYDVDPAHHDVGVRMRQDSDDGVGRACVSLSAPLGIENLVRPEAGALLAAWHEGAEALPDHYAPWASVPMVDPDLDLLARQLGGRFVGLQLPATDLLSPAAWERAGDLLRVAEEANVPVLVHPGPELTRPLAGSVPGWWAPVVGYVSQMQAAWWGWHAVGGRTLFPRLRVVFAAGAGLAPVHHERQTARGGEPARIDPDVYVETSSYGPQALDALVRVLGVDVLTLGSDRPYAAPIARLLGDAATHAIRVANPARLLAGPDLPARVANATDEETTKEETTWPRAS